MKKFTTILLCIVFAGCAQTPENPSTSEGTIVITASFYPLAEIARNVAGSEATVITITPAGSDPHEYEPSPRDRATISTSDLFIFNGEGQDPWAERLEETLNETATIHMTAYVALLEGREESEDHEEGHEDDDHHHEHDPHIWLDPTIAAQEAKIIADTLSTIDPQNAQTYQTNLQTYTDQLLQLDREFQQKLSSCRKQKIITAHAAFSYMAERYGFEQIAIAGLSPEQEPSARKLAEIADIAEENDIRYIFFESLTSPRISETLANEVGATTLLLDPLEGLNREQIEAGENYVTVMRNNLNNLVTALECT